MSENIDNSTSIETYLSGHYDFQYNEITNKLGYRLKKEKVYNELKEYDLNTIVRELKQAGVKKVMKKEVAEILNSSFTPIINPFKNYFNKLKSWKDGHDDYIDALASTITVPESEQLNWKAWFKKWIIGVVACAVDVEKINQTAIIFVGKQGIGKTTWMKKLIPEELKDYYYGGSINLGNKDTEIQLSENLLINLDELENLGRKNISSLKEIITKPSIKIRRPYGAFAENMPRRASFMGSVNNKEFLKDETGNRRFLCFETLSINHSHTIDMDKVYAQAYFLCKKGEKFWFDGGEISMVNEHNESYKSITLEQEILLKYFEPVVGNQKPELQLETEDLVNYICEKSKLAKRLSPRNLGSALTQLNWQKKKTNGRRYWLLIEKKEQIEIPNP